MEYFFKYLIMSNLTIIFFYVFYRIFLRNESSFNLNRYFLVFTLVFSCVLPFFDLTFISNRIINPYVVTLKEVVVSNTINENNIRVFRTVDICGFIYLLVSCFFLLKFIINIISILNLRFNGKKIISKDNTIIKLDKNFLPFSFFKTIFIGNNSFRDEDFNRIILHEKAHIKGWHTLDILLVEMLKSFFWWNPVLWLFKKQITEVHEFIADRSVYSSGNDIVSYRKLLISQVISGYKVNLINSFNNSIITRRIKMMSKSESGRFSYLKYLTVIPIIMVMMIICGTVRISAQEQVKIYKGKNIKSSVNADRQTSDTEPSLDMKKLAKAVVYPKEAINSGLEGKVMLNVMVDKKGYPTQVTVVESTNKIFDQAAIDAVKKMKFKPAKKGNKKVDAEIKIPVVFKLN
jgi:TonB family protein